MAGGRVVWCGGGTGALGRAVVRAFLAEGDRLAVPYRDEGKWRALAEAEAAAVRDGRLLGLAADLTREADVEEAVRRVAERWGRLDVALNLAGGFAAGGVDDTPSEVWDRLFAVNVKTAALTTRAVFPLMRRQGGGVIVNVGARTALAGSRTAVAYAATKAALLRLTEATAEAGRPHRIRCVAVLPGILDTPANRAALPGADPSRWVRPEQVARVIRWLCSPDAEPISGALVPVYGRS